MRGTEIAAFHAFLAPSPLATKSKGSNSCSAQATKFFSPWTSENFWAKRFTFGAERKVVLLHPVCCQVQLGACEKWPFSFRQENHFCNWVSAWRDNDQFHAFKLEITRHYRVKMVCPVIKQGFHNPDFSFEFWPWASFPIPLPFPWFFQTVSFPLLNDQNHPFSLIFPWKRCLFLRVSRPEREPWFKDREKLRYQASENSTSSCSGKRSERIQITWFFEALNTGNASDAAKLLFDICFTWFSDASEWHVPEWQSVHFEPFTWAGFTKVTAENHNAACN